MTDAPRSVSTEQVELRHCPFCGGKSIDPTFWASADESGPGCDDCGATAETPEKWNNRSGDVAQAAPDSGDVRWAVNVLLEKIAVRFDKWDTADVWRDEAAATVRSFKHDLAASQPASNAYAPIVLEALRLAQTCLNELTDDDPSQYAISKRKVAAAISSISSTPRASLWDADCSRYPDCKCDAVCVDMRDKRLAGRLTETEKADRAAALAQARAMSSTNHQTNRKRIK